MQKNDLEALKLFSNEDIEKYNKFMSKFRFTKSSKRISNDMSYLTTREERQRIFNRIFSEDNLQKLGEEI